MHMDCGMCLGASETYREFISQLNLICDLIC